MTDATQPRRQLSLFDSVAIIVGIIIGSGIYETTPLIASNVTGPAWLLLVWVLGAVLSLAGALCYAELITRYPMEGGDYVYLNQAFSGRWGFLFAWAQFWVVRPGSIGAMAYVFGQYANRLLSLDDVIPYPQTVYACAAIALPTLLNMAGAKEGKWTQNILSTAKVLGLLALFVVAVIGSVRLSESPDAGTNEVAAPAAADTAAEEAAAEDAADSDAAKEEESAPAHSFGLAMILVLFAYGGWNEIAFVAAEVREPRRNILPALVIGLAVVALVYVLTVCAFLAVLGFEGVRQPGVAANTLERVMGTAGAKAISLLVCISALGAVAGQIFAGARIFYAFGREHRTFAPLGVWNARFDTPLRSLAAQGLITLALAVLFGTPLWARLVGDTSAAAEAGQAAFEPLVRFTTPAVWFFFLLVGLALFKLRDQRQGEPDAFRVPWYPFTPFIFCLSCVALLQSSVLYAYHNRSYEAFWSLGILGVGLVLALFSRRQTT